MSLLDDLDHSQPEMKGSTHNKALKFLKQKVFRLERALEEVSGTNTRAGDGVSDEDLEFWEKTGTLPQQGAGSDPYGTVLLWH